eukprot:UN27912
MSREKRITWLKRRGFQVTSDAVRKFDEIHFRSFLLQEFACAVTLNNVPKMIEYLQSKGIMCFKPLNTFKFRLYRHGYESCNFDNGVARQIKEELIRGYFEKL